MELAAAGYVAGHGYNGRITDYDSEDEDDYEDGYDGQQQEEEQQVSMICQLQGRVLISTT